METIRRLIKGWLGKTLLVLFCAPFIFSGFEGIFGQSTAERDAVISVNGKTVDAAELTGMIQNMKAARQSQLPEGLNISDFISDALFKQLAVQQLTDQLLLESFAEETGVVVSDLQAMMQLAEQFPQLKTEAGRFNLNALADLLAQSGSGYSVEAVIDDVRASLSRFQLAQSFELGDFVLPSEAARQLTLQWEGRSVDVLKVPADAFREEIKIDQSEIEEWYQRNKNEYSVPERVLPSYVRVNLQQYIDENAVTEEEIKAAYEKEVKAKQSEEERKSRHILVEINDSRNMDQAKERAQTVLNELNAGASFEDLVAKYSDDLASKIDGGDLGFAERSVFHKSFADALFSLEKSGDRSGLVETSEGVHIIELTDVRLPEIPSFETEMSRLRSVLAKEAAREYFDSIYDRLVDAAVESGSLDGVAQVSNSEIVNYPSWVSPDATHDIFKNDSIKSALFSSELIEDGLNSDVIEIADYDVVVVRVREHQPKSIQPLEEVDGAIRGKILQDKTKKAAEGWALAQVVQLAQGEAIDWPVYYSQVNNPDSPNRESPKWDKYPSLFRASSNVDRDLIDRIFEMAKPVSGSAAFDVYVKNSGDVYVLKLNHVQRFEPIPPKDSLPQDDKNLIAEWEKLGMNPNQTMRDELALQFGRIIGRASLSFLKNKAEIIVKTDEEAIDGV